MERFQNGYLREVPRDPQKPSRERRQAGKIILNAHFKHYPWLTTHMR